MSEPATQPEPVYVAGGTVQAGGGVYVSRVADDQLYSACLRGGIAYVLDEDGSFLSRCNLGMVELGAVSDADDLKQLHALVTRHRQYTGSTVAQRALEDWDGFAKKFVKVLPTEYRAVLERLHLGANNDMARLAAV